jgi:hypothetical protein
MHLRPEYVCKMCLHYYICPMDLTTILAQKCDVRFIFSLTSVCLQNRIFGRVKYIMFIIILMDRAQFVPANIYIYREPQEYRSSKTMRECGQTEERNPSIAELPE